MRRRALLPRLVLLAACLSMYPTRAPGDDFTPVVGSVLGADTMAVRGSDGRSHVVYELLLTNAKAVPATLEKLEVLRPDGDGKALVSLEGAGLLAALHTLDARPAAAATLPPNESRILFVNIDFAGPEEMPSGLRHRLEATGAASPAARAPSQIHYPLAPLDLAGRRPPAMRSPLEGAGWVALNGCCSGAGAHRGAIQSVNGQLFNSQRFAIDWMRLDDQGRMVVGDPAKPESFVGYGAPVLAAAAGTVIDVGDGLPDQPPGKLPDPNTITIATVDGNHVVIDHGEGIFTFYAHLRSGSVAVKLGDAVAAGQKLGLLGNSGNTSAPHLHFHVMTGRSPLGSDGIPFEIDRFTMTQRLDDADVDPLLAGGKVELARSAASPIERALPLDLTVVDFGSLR